MYDPKDAGKYWVRTDALKSLLHTGCEHHHHGKDIGHSWEGTFGWKDFKGIMGHPVALRGGFSYKLGENTDLTANGFWGENYSINQEV